MDRTEQLKPRMPEEPIKFSEPDYRYRGVCHLQQIMRPESGFALIEKALETLTPISDKFDTIVACGVSGLLVATPVAFMLKKPMAVVRKEYDQTSHHSQRIEGNHGMQNYLFVDDFISSGETLKYMVKSIQQYLDRGLRPTFPRLFGTYEAYNRNSFTNGYDVAYRWGVEVEAVIKSMPIEQRQIPDIRMESVPVRPYYSKEALAVLNSVNWPSPLLKSAMTEVKSDT